MKTATLFAAMALIGGVSVANADDLLVLSSDSMESVTAAGGPGVVNIFSKLNVKKDVDVKVDIKGNLADAVASANAKGENTLAETFTNAYATTHSSSAFSSSIAAVAGGR